MILPKVTSRMHVYSVINNFPKVMQINSIACSGKAWCNRVPYYEILGDLRWKNYLWPQENFSDKNLIGEWEIWGGILGFTSRWNACSYQKTPRTCYQEFVDEVILNFMF